MIMNTSTGRGIYLEGATPQVLLEDSQMRITDTGSSQGIILQGTDALLSLSNRSELAISGDGTGTTENIQIGNNSPRPELSVTGGSKLSVTATSGPGAATDTTNNAVHIRGVDPVLELEQSELQIEILDGPKRGVYINGQNANLKINNSNLDLLVAKTAYGIDTTESTVGKAIIQDSTLTTRSGRTSIKVGDTFLVDNSKIFAQNLLFHAATFIIENNSEVELIQDGSLAILRDSYLGSEALLGTARNGVQDLIIRTNSKVNIELRDRTDSSLYGLTMWWGRSTVSVESSAQLNIVNEGNGVPSDSMGLVLNVGVAFRGGNSNKFRVTDPGSRVDIKALYGSAITNSQNGNRFSMDLEVSNLGYFSAVGNTATNVSGTFHVSTLNVNFDNPLFLDFRNLQSTGGLIFSITNESQLVAKNSDLALWERRSDLNADPTFNFRSLDYSFSGWNFAQLTSTSRPEELNTSVIGTTGLSQFSRLSSNNGRWAIADELRVPTNADKKIHGRVSLPVGLDDSRPAWDDEAIVTVEVESPSGDKKQEYTAKTVGHTNESPGISIYGEEPRGGLFEIDLDEPLEAGAKVRISKVELTSGELTEGFEHQILTDTVEVFPIIPPKPAQFSGSMIAQDSRTIQGMTDNLDAEVTATLNGEPLNTEPVKVDTNGKFILDLSEVSLEMDDEIQVFLRDAEGSAKVARVINPPETNNDRGNINPKTEFTFHDVTFEPATIVVVGDVGPVSPVDPLDPEAEVDPENKPELPEDQGPLSIDFISAFNFGSQAISVQSRTYYAQPQQLLNPDGTIIEGEERPNYIQVSDRRAENDRHGWQLAVTQNSQFTNLDDHELAGARLHFSNQQFATAQGGTEPELSHRDGVVLVPGQKTELVTAKGEQGSDTWIYRFGDRASAGESVALEVPPTATPKATTYHTTLTWELSAVPENE
ncbi:WxL domain-containing protein (plasmid) [Enterococcus gallinarum]|nr:WxL domain-containing protein [Enterococcus gallinarum]